MRRSGLRTRMAVSYVLVTAAAVVLVEGVVLGILLPRILASSSRASQAATVAGRAGYEAKLLSELVGSIAAQSPRGVTDENLARRLAQSPRLRELGLTGPTGAAPRPGAQCLPRADVEALISVTGTVLATSNPLLCPVGVGLGFATLKGLPSQGTLVPSHREILWAVSPVVYPPGKGAAPTPTPDPSPAGTGAPTPTPDPSPTATASGSPAPVASTTAGSGHPPGPGKILPGHVLAGLYAGAPAHPEGVSFAQVRPLLIAGGLVLALVIPVGTVFGLLSTRRVIRRIKRLAEVTGTVAGGDFEPRVPVSGGDEIGQLEDAFNQMTARLSAAVDAERGRAGADARQAERARIARELHDSISQDLFSLSLLAAGLRRALHADPALRPEVTAMERTSARAMREMQALLLELRPVALEDAGLVPAVTELCQAYQARLAINVTMELGEVSLGPAAEHAVLRIVQEALGNAARHGEPETILVRLSQRNGSVTVEVRDDGRGFDPRGAAERHGMGLTLMRERVTELGGDLQLDATPGEGAAILVQLPAGQDGPP